MFDPFEDVKKELARSIKNKADELLDKAVHAGEEQIKKGVTELGKSIKDSVQHRDPSWFNANVTRLAKANEGELSVAKVIAELSITEEEAIIGFNRMIKSKLCQVKSGPSGERVYIFPIYKKQVTIKYCPYCDTEYDAKSELTKCENCSSSLEIKKIIR